MELAREVRRGSAGRVAPLSTLPEALAPKPLVPLGELAARSTCASPRWTRRACCRRSPACSARTASASRVGDPEGTRPRRRASVPIVLTVHASGRRGRPCDAALDDDRPAARSDRADAADPHRGGALSMTAEAANPKYAPGSSAPTSSVRALRRSTRSSTRARDCAGLLRSSARHGASCARPPPQEWKRLFERARTDRVALRLGRLGQEGVGAARASTTRTSSRCTRATPNLFWAERYGRELGARGPLGQAVRQLAHRLASRTSA